MKESGVYLYCTLQLACNRCEGDMCELYTYVKYVTVTSSVR